MSTHGFQTLGFASTKTHGKSTFELGNLAQAHDIVQGFPVEANPRRLTDTQPP